MRLIDADELNRAMYNEVFLKDSEERKLDRGLWIRYKLYDRLLREAPTVEFVRYAPMVELVRYAHWEKAQSKGYVSYSEAYKQCSLCKEAQYKGDGMKYCPNCGAKMRVGDGKREKT